MPRMVPAFSDGHSESNLARTETSKIGLKDVAMSRAIGRWGIVVGCLASIQLSAVVAQDWPQWRGANRDAKATFTPPQTWPKSLTKKWQVDVGNGVATPALVGDRLYVFARRDGNEVTSCHDAATGKELWADKYAAKGASGAAAQFPGPRSSPTVADGKVITLGVQGTLSCLDAASGKKLWRKTEIGEDSVPRFFTSSSPIVVDGLCIAQFGGEEKGGIAAYDLTSGTEKWRWTGDGTAYASPDLLTIDGVKMVVALTANNVVGLASADGKLLLESPFAVKGMGGYNAATPIVGGDVVYISGSFRGIKALKIEKQGDAYKARELWKTARDMSVQFDTPVLKNGLLFGISARNFLFCLNAETGKTAWIERVRGDRGYGTVVDAGPVLLVLTTNGQLLVCEASDKKFQQVAKYTVAEDGTYAYPVAAGNRIFIKDFDDVTLWTVD
jgi:outer membrane protein assembly factor BamB